MKHSPSSPACQSASHRTVEVDPYAVLGVDPASSPEEVTAAYKHVEETLSKRAAEPWIRQAARDSYRALTEPATTKGSEAAAPKHLGLTGELLLQNEMTYFILVSVMDFFLTYLLLNLGAIEANPVANLLYKRFDFAGMLAFKLIIVAIVCIVTQVIAQRNLKYGRFVIWVGIIVTGLVVIYSMRLLSGQLS